MIECLCKENFNSFWKGDNDFTYDDFISYIESLDLNYECFYIDFANWVIPAWYIDGFVTIPIHALSKEYIEMIRLKDIVLYRKKSIEAALKERRYGSIFVLIEKCFRMSYFLDIYESLTDEEFLDLFEFVYSSCEYNFDMLLTEEVLERLKKANKTNKIKEALLEKYNIKDNVITIYRGEADESTHYEDGAFSWTLDPEVADFFANRFNAEYPKIYKANVNVGDILMVIDKESEVLISPNSLLNVEEI